MVSDCYNIMQMILCRASAIVLAAFVVGCSAPPRPMPYPSYAAPARFSAPAAMTHDYTVRVVDVDGKPVPDVAVDVTVQNKDSTPLSVQCKTDADGRCPPVQFEARRDPQLTYVKSYMSTAKAEGKKDGFYAAKATGISDQGSETTSLDRREMTLRMIRPTDYLSDGFSSSPADRELRERVLRFIDVIRLQGLLSESEVMLKGIGTTEFKGKKYLTVKINSTNTFNTLKMGKYDIGKRLFDDSVRKMLSPLNDVIAAPRAYYGYDLVVYGHSKSFAEKYATPSKHEFRFLMPESTVRRYKDKDISGQALLDASVLLLDDERIDMKLQ